MMTNATPAPAPVVLLVEDEVLVRIVAADILVDAGFHVVKAVNAAKALMVLKVRGDITAAVTDVYVPGRLSGLKLAAAVAQRCYIGL
ncbi:hypothetical protein [Microvirga arabica]|uniref:hypothetical protein n=1 Tax=Microvirga arabica TaxID=1128671 RepID=UPI001939AA7B|nr:hypothetical protein [Microvirga arabica]MBM1174321.1 hypothetical protein [Microvirga arabica]